MVSFPKFGYTDAVEKAGAKVTLSDEVYRYYHKLYFLTRTTLPRWFVGAVGRSRLARRFPSLIDRLLPEKLPFFFLGDEPTDHFKEIINLPHAQAVIPGGELDRGAPEAAHA